MLRGLFFFMLSLLTAVSVSAQVSTAPAATPTSVPVPAAAPAPAPDSAAAAPTATPTSAPTPATEWKPALRWSGDLRFRYLKMREDVDDIRDFQELRVRLGLLADVNETTQAVIRLATGTSSKDQNSAVDNNQVLGDSNDPGMPRRSFGLDLAFMDLKFLSTQSLQVWAGRTANPFWAAGGSQILFDEDLAFEGVALRWDPQWSFGTTFVHVGAFMISENYAAPQDVVDTGLVGTEFGYSKKLGESHTLTAHVGQYTYVNIQDKAITTVAKYAATDPFSYPYDDRYMGNITYVNDPSLPKDTRKYYFQDAFIINQVGGEYRFERDNLRAVAFVEFLQNMGAPELQNAFETGASVKWYRWQAGYVHSMKQSESTVGAFTDNEMNGGGTDNVGDRVNVAYDLGRNTMLSLTSYRATRGMDEVSRDYSATQLDLLAWF